MNKILLAFSCFLAVFADMLLVWFAKEKSHPTVSLILGIVLVNIATIIWTYTMKKGIESADAITFYALFTVIGCSFLGIVIFKEPVSVVNGVGMLLGLIALIMIGL